MPEGYRVRFRSRSARKDLDDLDDETYLRIAAAIFHLRENPRPPGTEKLTGQAAYRIRISNFRILYTVDDKAKEVRIEAVRKRDERTYD
ncbi:MAG: type II toxin-antitoxin system RelE/ParE family toxin [Candidatus Rokubacteria bacterium]|nr:type II toxin-antitoxin system RelE/ParE family toxin [Candidatus Rokubacteria bacterium]